MPRCRAATLVTHAAASKAAPTAVRVHSLLSTYRTHGHRIARLDPLQLDHGNRPSKEMRALFSYSFSDVELREPVHLGEDGVGFERLAGTMPLQALIRRTQHVYAGTLAVESSHCDPVHAAWLQDQLETVEPPAFSADQRRRILGRLCRAHVFEAFLGSKFTGVKRFGVEGGEALIVGLDELLECASANGVSDCYLGMAHRGRLNVLANVAGKPVEAILCEFNGGATGTAADEATLRAESESAFHHFDADDSGVLEMTEVHAALRRLGVDATYDEAQAAMEAHDADHSGAIDRQEFFELTARLLGRHWSGDVKYHLGTTQRRVFVPEGAPPSEGRTLTLSVLPNPSHLEAVAPLVVGVARARQLDSGRMRVLPLLLHGDAAFSGQGVVFETMGLSDLHDYTTGGAVHVVLNNQIGFTTTPQEARSSRYCTDVAKTVGAPILHVNGDDVDAVVRACRLAVQFRQAFAKDVVVDLVCYRRHGRA